jgi:hypothetical protein
VTAAGFVSIVGAGPVDPAFPTCATVRPSRIQKEADDVVQE